METESVTQATPPDENKPELTPFRGLQMSPEQKFEALRTRFLDQSQLLRHMTGVDFRIFGGYITIQLALGGWLGGENPLSNAWSAAGIALIDFVLAFIGAMLLRHNYQRRAEVVATLTNVMEALGYQAAGLYLQDRSINVKYTVRPWGPWFLLGVVVGYIGLLLAVIGALH